MICRNYLLNLRHTILSEMNNTIEKQVLNEIRDTKYGSIFFVDDFLNIGNAKAVNKSLERLVAKGELVRIATGIYVRPKKSNLLGILTPDIQEIASAIARRDKARIVPTGLYALNRLGLSTQVPMNVVYLTDGSARKIKIGNRSVLFKKAAPKNLSAVGEISGLVIQALKTIGKDNIEPYEEKRILDLLEKEEQKNIEHDIILAPEWIRKIMRKAIKNINE